mmetsp:Transcript_21236/g.56733  ORF Transcript_21236/g.56733 Transcript_21236/m.56733 type:complete len:224 (-) Transcript_21236:2257-2928(-)
MVAIATWAGIAVPFERAWHLPLAPKLDGYSYADETTQARPVCCQRCHHSNGHGAQGPHLQTILPISIASRQFGQKEAPAVEHNTVKSVARVVKFLEDSQVHYTLEGVEEETPQQQIELSLPQGWRDQEECEACNERDYDVALVVPGKTDGQRLQISLCISDVLGWTTEHHRGAIPNIRQYIVIQWVHDAGHEEHARHHHLKHLESESDFQLKLSQSSHRTVQR